MGRGSQGQLHCNVYTTTTSTQPHGMQAMLAWSRPQSTKHSLKQDIAAALLPDYYNCPSTALLQCLPNHCASNIHSVCIHHAWCTTLPAAIPSNKRAAKSHIQHNATPTTLITAQCTLPVSARHPLGLLLDFWHDTLGL